MHFKFVCVSRCLGMNEFESFLTKTTQDPIFSNLTFKLLILLGLGWGKEGRVGKMWILH